MTDLATLARELNTLETVQAALAGIADRTDDARKHELIKLRRDLSAQIAKVGEVAEPIFRAADPGLNQEYRNKFSRMRSAAALHQAAWPAIRLGENIADYKASARTVREANKAFVAWVRGTLAQLQQDR